MDISIVFWTYLEISTVPKTDTFILILVLSCAPYLYVIDFAIDIVQYMYF